MKGGSAESVERGRRPRSLVDERTIRSQGRNSGYRGWDACTGLSGTVETLPRRGLSHRVSEGIRYAPKVGTMRG